MTLLRQPAGRDVGPLNRRFIDIVFNWTVSGAACVRLADVIALWGQNACELTMVFKLEQSTLEI